MSVSQMVNYFEVLYNTQPSNTGFVTNEEDPQCTWQFEASVEVDDAAFQVQLRRFDAHGSTNGRKSWSSRDNNNVRIQKCSKIFHVVDELSFNRASTRPQMAHDSISRRQY